MRFETEDDFDLDKIAGSGQCFRWTREADGGYRIIASGRILHIRKEGVNSGRTGSGGTQEGTYGGTSGGTHREAHGGTHGEAYGGTFELSCTEQEFQEFWHSYFDLDEDYRTLRAGIPAEDRYLRKAAEAEAGVRILRQDPWETLATFVLSQRKNIPAIRQCVGKLCAAAGSKISAEDGAELYAFPSPEQVLGIGCPEIDPGDSPDCAYHLRGMDTCSLGYRLPYLYAAAQWALKHPELFIRDGGADEASLTDEALQAELCQIRGVGIKVASCTMLFGYHRMDAFPVDVWMQRTLAEHYPKGFDPRRYSPCAGLMQQYLFMAAREGISRISRCGHEGPLRKADA